MTFETGIVYIGLFIICLWFAGRADKLNKAKYIVVMITLLSLVAGLRAYSVGIDTSNYAKMFELIADKQFIYAYALEEAFKYLCFIFLFIWKSPTCIFLLLAFITNGFIIYRMWEYRSVANFRISFACYYLVFYFMTLNICRQLAAIALIFWATRYLDKRNYFKYIVVVLIASLIHQTSLIGLAFLMFELVNWKTLNKKQKRIITCGILLIPIEAIVFLHYIKIYSRYFVVLTNEIGIMLPIKILFLGLSLLIVRRRMFNPTDKGSIQSIQYQSRNTSLYYTFGLLLTFLGYFFAYMDRIGLVFYMFEGIHMGKIAKYASGNNKWIFKGLLDVILAYFFVTSLLKSAQGSVPYLFVWQHP